MPVRLRITLLFSLLVFLILGIVCTGIYYFSYKARVETIKTRLTNRAITTARLLSQREIFDDTVIRKIDSFTTIALKKKNVQVYDYSNKKIYNYRDANTQPLQIQNNILEEAREKGSHYFEIGKKEVVAYYYTGTPAMVVVSAGEDEDGRQTLKSLLNILIISFCIGNLFVLMAGYFFSRGLLLPVKKISEDVAEISAHNLTRRIDTGNTKDEWYQLSSTLNELLDRLQESFELQRRFIANASHELSTPLTSISSQLEVAMQRQRNAEDYLKVIESIYQDVQHMSKLTQTLLEFAKASGSKGGLEIDLVRMDEVVLRLPAETLKTDPSFLVKIEFKELPEEEDRLLVFGNETLIFAAIKNIVINACKYSSDHTANVQLTVAEKTIVISIEDKGPGIPSEELPNIFQPFYRLETTRQMPGFGLGLSLAERIIKIHKGSIEVRSALNKGTRFEILLPAASTLKKL